MHYLVSVIDDKIGSPRTDRHGCHRRVQRPAQGHRPLGLRRRPRAPSAATVIDNRGEAALTDGPFLETKEYIVGFWIIEAPDLDVALQPRGRGVEGLQPEGRGAPVPGRRVSVTT